MPSAEHNRLDEDRAQTAHWRRWGPYLADRQWGTVREDYSPDGDAWGFVTHETARSYAFRWGEDGLAGISDNHQRLCFAWAFWNEQDGILKERLFGLSNGEGNLGEDVKECYWFLDNTPTHSYMRFAYRYPQAAFPYDQLRAENARRSRTEPEFELEDTGIFESGRYFDIVIEFAKAGPEEVLFRISAVNRGPKPAPLHILPMLWFRNTWTWVHGATRPSISPVDDNSVYAAHPTLGGRYVECDGTPRLIFTENDTNRMRLYGVRNATAYVKDGFHRCIVEGESAAVCDDGGTRCAFWHHQVIAPGSEWQLCGRLRDESAPVQRSREDIERLFDVRKAEAEAFYETLIPRGTKAAHRNIARRAFAGLFWSKQWYHYVVQQWLDGDPAMPPPPKSRLTGRNHTWRHLYNDDVLNMPDTWEYPWYAVWDSAFHAVTLALADPALAKRQLQRFTREWYMHPSGQLPAYEWALSDTNPPVHAWAALRVFDMERAQTGKGDCAFLEAVFHKLLMNFTWWVNRKDTKGNNVFEGGFLGMDNIGVFDRSHPAPVEGVLEQSDATSWMAMYCLNMLRISWELARINPAYEDIASKFFEHFLYIADAIHNIDGTGQSLWNEEDGFFYDQLCQPDGTRIPLRVRSMVGLVPLFAAEILDYQALDNLPNFRRRMDWFMENRPDLTAHITCLFQPSTTGRCLLSLMQPPQLERLLACLLDEAEFLSPYGIRSLSKYHEAHPYWFEHGEFDGCVQYEPGTSESPMFGGNSNWRGPVWFPVNFLLIEALQKFHAFWGDALKLPFPTGSGQPKTLDRIADALAARLIALFEMQDGRRPYERPNGTGHTPTVPDDWLVFHEFFHGDTGEGLGASHQTGWTALVANLICEHPQRTRP